MAAANGVGAGEPGARIAAIVPFARFAAKVTNDHEATAMAGCVYWSGGTRRDWPVERYLKTDADFEEISGGKPRASPKPSKRSSTGSAGRVGWF
jgi:hypothetical protein